MQKSLSLSFILLLFGCSLTYAMDEDSLIIRSQGLGYVIPFNPNDTVGDLKQKIVKSISGFPIEEQRLTFLGQELVDDTKKISDPSINIEGGSMLYLNRKRILTIKTLTGKKIIMPYKNDTTIRDVQAKVQAMEGSLLGQPKFIFNGVTLDDSDPNVPLKGLGVESGDTVHLVIQYQPLSSSSLGAEPRTIRINVHDTMGTTISFQLNEDATLADLQKEIGQVWKENDPKDQELIVKGEKINTKIFGNVTLKELGIKDNATVQLKLKSHTSSHSSWKSRASYTGKYVGYVVKQHKIAIGITTAVLVAAVATFIKIRSYYKTKAHLIKKYHLKRLTSLQNKVWLATVLASHGMPWYLQSLATERRSSLDRLVGADPRAVAELYYGHEPTVEEVAAFRAKFFPEAQ